MKNLASFIALTILLSMAVCECQAQKYYKYQSNNNGLCVSYTEGLKVTCDDETKLEIEDDRLSFSALFCDAATLGKMNLKDNLEKVLKKTGIDRKTIQMMELKQNSTIEGSLYIGGNKSENADYQLIYGFVQCKQSPQIAFKVSVICNGDMAKEAGVMLGTLEFYSDQIK